MKLRVPADGPEIWNKGGNSMWKSVSAVRSGCSGMSVLEQRIKRRILNGATLPKIIGLNVLAAILAFTFLVFAAAESAHCYVDAFELPGDLGVSYVRAPSNASRGEEISVEVGVCEISLYPPGTGTMEFTVEIRLSSYTIIGPSARLLDSYKQTRFSTSVTRVVTVPNDINPGVYYVGVMINTEWPHIPELNYSNNTGYDPDRIKIDCVNCPILDTFAINGGIEATTNRTVVLNNTAIGNPTEYIASEDPALIFSGTIWESYSESPSFDLSSAFGRKRVYMRVRNQFGESNIEYDTIEYVQPIPVLKSMDINGGAVTTTSRNVVLDIVATNEPTEYIASEDSSFSGSVWKVLSSSPSFELSPEYGRKLVYVRVRNAFGESGIREDDIVYCQKPELLSFEINNGKPTANVRIVTLNTTTVNRPTRYIASERSDFNGADWIPYLPVSVFILSPEPGAKTVYLKVANSCGESAVLHDSIEWGTAPARTIYVSPTGDDSKSGSSWNEAKRTIQAGIGVAVDGDMVLVADGVYTGSNNVNLDLDGKAIVVKSANGPGNCIIDCEDKPDTRGFYFHKNEGSGSVIDGFTIRNGNFSGDWSSGGGGILCSNSSPMITNNVIEGNYTSASIGAEGGGICCFDSSPVIAQNTIRNNSANSGGGIYCGWDSSPIIAGNTIQSNLAYNGGGIYYSSSVGYLAAIIDNIIDANSTTGDGGGIYGFGRSIIANNTITGNSSGGGGGISCGSSEEVEIVNNKITGNSSASRSGGGIRCGSSPALSTIVRGNTITDNIAKGAAGIYCGEGSSPYITGNEVSSNLGSGGEAGHGIQCYKSDSPRIQENSISGNSGDGISCVQGFSPRIAGNTVSGNTGNGISVSSPFPIISGNKIIGNSEEGIGYSSSEGEIIGNIISGNGDGGMNCWEASALLDNNEITDNAASFSGGGLYCFMSYVTLMNNTIADNSASCGAGIFCIDSTAVITNTILWNDGPEEVYFASFLDPNAVSITHCDVRGGQSGIVTNNNGTVGWFGGNIDANPLFQDAESGDYHLLDTSPCIGAGVMAHCMPDMDIEGNMRPTPGNCSPDIGAYESDLCEPQQPFSDIHLSSRQHDFGDVLVGSYEDWILVISNKGNMSLGVTGVTSSNPAFGIVSPSFPEDIAPDASVDVKVRFSPPSENLYDNVSLTIASNDPDEPEVIVDLTGRGILKHPPEQPANISPANNASGITLTPVLQSSAFSDPDPGDSHTGSQWQITEQPGDYSAPIFDSGVDTENLIQFPIPYGVLKLGTSYHWHVRHRDVDEAWSAWSEETSFTTVTELTQEIRMRMGWNLISFALQLESTEPNVVFSFIEGEYGMVCTYDPDTKWSVYVPTEEFGDLKLMTQDKGYWIWVGKEVTLAVQGMETEQTAIPLKGNEWNLVAYNSLSPREVEDCIEAIRDYILSIWTYSADEGWFMYLPGEQGNLEVMEPGYGYWIRVDRDCELDVRASSTE